MTDDNNSMGRRKFLAAGATAAVGSTAGCIGADDGKVPGVDEPWERFIFKGKQNFQGKVNTLHNNQEKDESTLQNFAGVLSGETDETLSFEFEGAVPVLEEDNIEVEVDQSAISQYSLDDSDYAGRGVEIAPGIVIAPYDTGDINRESAFEEGQNAEYGTLEGQEPLGDALEGIDTYLEASSEGLSEGQRDEIRGDVNDLSSLGVFFEQDAEEQPIFPEASFTALEEQHRELMELEAVFTYLASEAGDRRESASEQADMLKSAPQEHSTELPFVGELWGHTYDDDRDLNDVEAHQMVEGLNSLQAEAGDLRYNAVQKAAEVGVLRRTVEYAMNEFSSMDDRYGPSPGEGEPSEPSNGELPEGMRAEPGCGIDESEIVDETGYSEDELFYKTEGEDLEAEGKDLEVFVREADGSFENIGEYGKRC